jgi:tripartite-type tricarboxylate transporter receptor subunit TctC
VTPASIVTIYPHVYRQLGYDPFTDLAPLTTVAAAGSVLAVGSKVPDTVRNVREFAQWCRLHPAAAQCGNPGAGSMPHFMAVLLQRELALEFTHVPYRGGVLAMQAVAAGELSAALATEAGARALAEAGRLRVLATTAAERSPVFPNVPTFKEQGLPSLVRREWFGAFAPGGTAPARVQALVAALHAALDDADTRSAWERAGLTVEHNTPAQLLADMRSEHAFWGQVAKASGFTPES